MSRARLYKRRLIVEAIISGVTIAAVARQLRVSRLWASREAHAPGTRHLLAQLLAPHAERLAQLLHTSYRTVLEAFEADKVVSRKGRLINLGPDHRVRLEAVEVAIDFIKKLGPHHWAVLNQRVKVGMFNVNTPVSAASSDHRVRLEAVKVALRLITKLDADYWTAVQRLPKRDTSEICADIAARRRCSSTKLVRRQQRRLRPADEPPGDITTALGA